MELYIGSGTNASMRFIARVHMASKIVRASLAALRIQLELEDEVCLGGLGGVSGMGVT